MMKNGLSLAFILCSTCLIGISTQAAEIHCGSFNLAAHTAWLGDGSPEGIEFREAIPTRLDLPKEGERVCVFGHLEQSAGSDVFQSVTSIVPESSVDMDGARIVLRATTTLREKPNENSEFKGVFGKGKTLLVLHREGSWFKITDPKPSSGSPNYPTAYMSSSLPVTIFLFP